MVREITREIARVERVVQRMLSWGAAERGWMGARGVRAGRCVALAVCARAGSRLTI